MGIICDVHYVFHWCLLSLLCGIAKLCLNIQVSSSVHYPFSVRNRYKASSNTTATVLNSPLCSSCFVAVSLLATGDKMADCQSVWVACVVRSGWTVYCGRSQYECLYFREEVDGFAQLSQWMLQRFAKSLCRLALGIFSFGLGHLRDYVTPWSRLPCGMLTFAKLLSKLAAFCGNQKA